MSFHIKSHLPRSVQRLAGLLLLSTLAACGGGGSAPVPTEPAAQRPEALAASKSGDLLAYFRDRLDKRWAAGLSSGGAPIMTFVGAISAMSAPAEAYSGTVLQEAGVDEDDLIKTDGNRIFSLLLPGADSRVPQLLSHQRLADGRLQAAGSLLLSSTASSLFSTNLGLYLSPDASRLAVVGQGWRSAGIGDPCAPGLVCISDSQISILPYEVWDQTTLDLVGIDAASALTAEHHIAIDGRLIGTRRIGNQLYIVTTWQPRLTVDALPLGTSVPDRQAALDKLSTADLLPGIRIDGGTSQPLLQDTDCWVQPANASLDLRLTTITRLDLSAPTPTQTSRCIVGGSEAMSMSATTLVLATTRDPVSVIQGQLRYAPAAATDVHKFALGSQGVDYRGSGSVPGHLGWSDATRASRLSEYQGDIRVLSFTGETGWASLAIDSLLPTAGASPATLTVLRESGSGSSVSLAVVGQLPSAKRPQWLGHEGEQVYAVQLLGDKGYLVTFRRTDPLYVLDLSDPTDPRVAGELQAPGFSEHLFALPDGLLFGVGRDADEKGRAGGLKVALFDVSDASRPTMLASQTFGDAASDSTLSYSRHGINLFTQGSTTRIALPMFEHQPLPAVSQQGLQRFEVDGTARSLRVLSMLGARQTPTMDPESPLWAERSVQIGAQVHWLTHRGLSSWDW